MATQAITSLAHLLTTAWAKATLAIRRRQLALRVRFLKAEVLGTRQHRAELEEAAALQWQREEQAEASLIRATRDLLMLETPAVPKDSSNVVTLRVAKAGRPPSEQAERQAELQAQMRWAARLEEIRLIQEINLRR